MVYHKRINKHILIQSYHRYRVVCGKSRGSGSYMSKFDRKVDIVVFLGGEVTTLLKGGHIGRTCWYASGQPGGE